MKTMLEKMRNKINRCMFDVAAAPMFIVIFGVPILLAVIIIGLIYLAVKALTKISREKKQEDRDQ